MKNIQALQKIVNDTDKQLGGVYHHNLREAVERALRVLTNEPQLLRDIVSEALSRKAIDNTARAIDEVVSKVGR